MPRSRFALGFGRVNLIKKVKVDGKWRFCPAIVDPGRRLSNKVRVKGEIEIHNEGTYYLEWHEHGRRRRQPVYSRALVIEQARVKTLELEAQHKPGEIGSPAASPLPFPVNTASPAPTIATHQFPPVTTFPNLEMQAVHLIWRGIELYLQELIAKTVHSQLTTAGVITQVAVPIDGTTKASALAQSGPPPNEAKTRSSAACEQWDFDLRCH